MEWFLGDIFNLTGAILAHQLSFQVLAIFTYVLHSLCWSSNHNSYFGSQCTLWSLCQSVSSQGLHVLVQSSWQYIQERYSHVMYVGPSSHVGHCPGKCNLVRYPGQAMCLRQNYNKNTLGHWSGSCWTCRNGPGTGTTQLRVAHEGILPTVSFVAFSGFVAFPWSKQGSTWLVLFE